MAENTDIERFPPNQHGESSLASSGRSEYELNSSHQTSLPRRAQKRFYEKLENLKTTQAKNKQKGISSQGMKGLTEAARAKKKSKKERVRLRMEQLRKGKEARNREVMLQRVFQYPKRARKAFEYVAKEELDAEIVDTLKCLVDETINTVGKSIFYTPDEDLGDYTDVNDDDEEEEGSKQKSIDLLDGDEEVDWIEANANLSKKELRAWFERHRKTTSQMALERKHLREEQINKMISQRNMVDRNLDKLRKVFQFSNNTERDFRLVAEQKYKKVVVDIVKNLVDATIASFGENIYFRPDDKLAEYVEENNGLHVAIPKKPKPVKMTLDLYRQRWFRKKQEHRIRSTIILNSTKFRYSLRELSQKFKYPKNSEMAFKFIAAHYLDSEVIDAVEGLVDATVDAVGDTVYYHPEENLANFVPYNPIVTNVEDDPEDLVVIDGKNTLPIYLPEPKKKGRPRKFENSDTPPVMLPLPPKRAKVTQEPLPKAKKNNISTPASVRTSTFTAKSASRPLKQHEFTDSPSRVIPKARGRIAIGKDKENKSPPERKRRYRTPSLSPPPPPPKKKMPKQPEKKTYDVITRSRLLDEVAESKKKNVELGQLNHGLKEKIKVQEAEIERRKREDMIKRRLMLGEIERQDEEVVHRQKVNDLALKHLRSEAHETLKFVLARAEEVENLTQKLRSDCSHLRLAAPKKEEKKDENKDQPEAGPSNSAEAADTTVPATETPNQSNGAALNPESISLQDPDQPSTSAASAPSAENEGKKKEKKKRIRTPRVHKKIIRPPTPPRLAKPNSKTNDILRRQKLLTPPEPRLKPPPKSKETPKDEVNRFVVPQMTSLKTGNVVVATDIPDKPSENSLPNVSTSPKEKSANKPTAESPNVIILNESSTIIVKPAKPPAPVKAKKEAPKPVAPSTSTSKAPSLPKTTRTVIVTSTSTSTPSTSRPGPSASSSRPLQQAPATSMSLSTPKTKPKKNEPRKEEVPGASAQFLSKRYLQMNTNDKKTSQSEFRNKIRSMFPNFTDEDLVDLIGESFPNLFNFDS
ncbi:unnamed protein product [Bursaphelenchus xylophilus]|uniref:(pine wood nematode) hypothetical protein n=1 Tax=Bursaphelenchus xylophilus TaxID=6326 RepID=A0A1I7RSP6_BURXY|nr:unnamed protein product [Bursaphelenchus xylophilus]CAG9122845.1 unnamed protein product [Bursaphelenchus xylophilus]